MSVCETVHFCLFANEVSLGPLHLFQQCNFTRGREMLRLEQKCEAVHNIVFLSTLRTFSSSETRVGKDREYHVLYLWLWAVYKTDLTWKWHVNVWLKALIVSYFYDADSPHNKSISNEPTVMLSVGGDLHIQAHSTVQTSINTEHLHSMQSCSANI